MEPVHFPASFCMEMFIFSAVCFVLVWCFVSCYLYYMVYFTKRWYASMVYAMAILSVWHIVVFSCQILWQNFARNTQRKY